MRFSLLVGRVLLYGPAGEAGSEEQDPAYDAIELL